MELKKYSISRDKPQVSTVLGILWIRLYSCVAVRTVEGVERTPSKRRRCKTSVVRLLDPWWKLSDMSEMRP